MKRIIYEPAIGEKVPYGAQNYESPVAIDVIVEDDFVTAGKVYHDKTAGIIFPQPFIHQFAGWEE